MKRKKFFMAMLAVIIASVVLEHVVKGTLLLTAQNVLRGLLIIAGVFRMKEAGRSAAWAALLLVPFVGFTAFAIQAMRPDKEEAE